MNIPPPDMPGNNRPGKLPQPKSATASSEKPPVTQNITETQTARLQTLISQKGFSVTPTIMQSLESELLSLGLQSSGLDDAVYIRAFLLHSNKIPLSIDVLSGSFEGEQTVFQQLGPLISDARALVSGEAMSVMNRSALEGLLNEIDSLMNRLGQSWRFDGELVTTGGKASGPGADTQISVPVRDLLLSDGQLFEWRLLAWYRSGRDPAQLRTLLQKDIKGLLTDFLGKFRTNREKGRARKKLVTLERDAEKLLDGITSRQLSNVLSSKDDRRGLFMEIPFGDTGSHGDAHISVNGRKQQESVETSPETFSIVFDVETSHIGRINVSLNVVDSRVTALVELDSDDRVLLAREMQAELLSALKSSGFDVGQIIIGRVKTKSEDTSDNRLSAGVDLLG
ncbi:hypothetical protein ACFL47_02170 [Candidatus Latescibacterota bacterium]